LRRLSLIIVLCLGVVLTGCVREQPQVIVITATFLPPDVVDVNVPSATQAPFIAPTEVVLGAPAINPTLNVPIEANGQMPTQHIVQVGDTLFEIAQQYNVSMNALIANNNLTNPDILEVGQVLLLPNIPTEQTPLFKIIPDSRLVRAPGSRDFDMVTFVAQQAGYVRNATDRVTTRIANGAGFDEFLTATQVIGRVALEYSIDPRLLLAILEYRAGWLSNPTPREDLLIYPIVSEANSNGFDRVGLYKQLAYTANELNRGYYAWKTRGLRTLEFVDGTRLQIASSLNSGTIALQYFLSLNASYADWLNQVNIDGIYQVYLRYFGDPFAGAVEPLVPNIQQPPMTLPFASGEIWYYTGGAHGGWGAGSAWASLDFAPPDERVAGSAFCYTSDYFVRAIAPGVIARSEGGAVVLDLDGDGDESTGWTIFYLHLADTIPVGTVVIAGDAIGKPSCAGGVSTATHLHIARRYNGEWLPVDCANCLVANQTPTFVMSEWVATGIAGQEYQGYMSKNGVNQQAEQGRETTINNISW
jgi:LasA protease